MAKSKVVVPVVKAQEVDLGALERRVLDLTNSVSTLATSLRDKAMAMQTEISEVAGRMSAAEYIVTKVAGILKLRRPSEDELEAARKASVVAVEIVDPKARQAVEDLRQEVKALRDASLHQCGPKPPPFPPIRSVGDLLAAARLAISARIIPR